MNRRINSILEGIRRELEREGKAVVTDRSGLRRAGRRPVGLQQEAAPAGEAQVAIIAYLDLTEVQPAEGRRRTQVRQRNRHSAVGLLKAAEVLARKGLVTLGSDQHVGQTVALRGRA